MITLARLILTTASLLTLAMGTGAARAAESCSAYPTGTAEGIDSSDLASKLGAVPKPGKELRFAYVTKTLFNEFWQDVAAGVKNEAAKYGIKVDVQAAKDELSMVEQLNLAQTVASQKPDALLLSPQSDSNLAPVIKAAIAANIPTVIIDDARTSGASSYIGTDQVKIGAQAATFLHDTNPKGGKVAQIEGAAGSPNARARIKGFKEQLATYPDLQLVASQPGNWDRLTALNATSNILVKTRFSSASTPTTTAWR
jgi:ribose transport system substrate-binding protein